MSLFVSTTGVDVEVPELGISIPHPTLNLDLTLQFSEDEISRADSLTQAIESGLLIWRKTSSGSVQSPSDYDKDWVYVATLSEGPSQENVLAVGSGGGGPLPSVDFNFKGFVSVRSNSSFSIAKNRVRVISEEDVFLEVNGSISVLSEGRVSTNNGSISVRRV